MKLLGVDTGGTFTDLILYDGGEFRVHKQLSTPDAPEKAIIEGVRSLGLSPRRAPDVVHGSTVGTNAVLEGKGVKTAYVANRGFGDVLTIGRQARPEIYRLTPEPVPPPVAPELCLETGGRVGARGEVVEPLTPGDVEALKMRLAELAPEAVAINLLFSFMDDRFERMIAQALEDDYFVSRSSDVLAESGEYERGIATWLNAYVGPIMRRYLKRLDASLPSANVSVMQSHGKTIVADKAGDYAVNLLLSGPAGGVIAARHVAAAAGASKVLSFDMGGTSTDVSVIVGDVALTTEGRIGPYPIAAPMVDVHTVGSGGGSIAYVDEGGLLRVGPQSAGASPGPACYGRGGGRPTVTDANLLLGRLPERLGGSLTLDRAAAVRAFEPLAEALGKSVAGVAQGVMDVANEQMEQALKVVSVQKGHDPSEFTLVGFGAAGGLHVCTLAEGMKIRRVIVPAHAGVLSAFGMLIAPRGLQKSRTLCVDVAAAEQQAVDAVYQRLREEAGGEMRTQGIGVFDVAETAELRYAGQSHCLTLERRPLTKIAQAFHEAHRAHHGYVLDAAVELVTLRVSVFSESPLKSAAAGRGVAASPPSSPSSLHRSAAEPGKPMVYRRADLAGKLVSGPALIVEPTSTVYVEEGWRASLDGFGNLQLENP